MVGETILLSNAQHKKLIKLKPIEINSPKISLVEKKEDTISELEAARAELAVIRKQQSELLTETTSKIDKARKDWEQERLQYVEQAKTEGYHAGYEIGKQESTDKYSKLLEKGNAVAEAALTDYHATIEQSEETILELAIRVAEKIICQQLTSNKAVFLPIVAEAIQEIKDQSVITIYLHPDNYQSVLNEKEELARLLDADTKLTIYTKADLAVNDCVIEHPFGQIDASIDTQLEQIRVVLQQLAMENKQ